MGIYRTMKNTNIRAKESSWWPERLKSFYTERDESRNYCWLNKWEKTARKTKKRDETARALPSHMCVWCSLLSYAMLCNLDASFSCLFLSKEFKNKIRILSKMDQRRHFQQNCIKNSRKMIIEKLLECIYLIFVKFMVRLKELLHIDTPDRGEHVRADSRFPSLFVCPRGRSVFMFK